MQSVQSCERESSSSWQELLLVWQMQSYDYDKYNRTIPTNTILLIQSWAAKEVRGNHHHPHCCSWSCSLYERLVDPQTTGGWPLTITPNTISLRQMQSYNYDKYNRTIETNTILLLQSWAEGQVKTRANGKIRLLEGILWKGVQSSQEQESSYLLLVHFLWHKSLYEMFWQVTRWSV